MALKYNPFKPGALVSPGMFCGRFLEFQILEKGLFQTKNGNPFHFLVHGERGIGKSSLLFNLEWVADGRFDPLEGNRFNFITVSIVIGPDTSFLDLVKKIGSELHRQVSANQQYKEMAKALWDFLTCWEVIGVKFNERFKSSQPEEVLDELVFTIEKILKEFDSKIDGILILIDEADKASDSTRLGEFTKVFTERLTQRGCDRVCLGLSGISNVIDKLRQSHESSLRIFEMLLIQPLDSKDRIEVVRRGLKVAEEKNGFAVTITPEAENWIAFYSEGFPHFIQQFSFCAFEEDADNLITEDDVNNGAFKAHGAYQQLGQKYYADQYFDQISSDEYRKVLQVMSEQLDGWIGRTDIIAKSKLKPGTVDNALRALRERNIIVAQHGKKGMYRLPTKSFAVWINAFSKRPSLLSQILAERIPG